MGKLNKKIKEVMGSKLKAITKKLEEMRSQLDKAKAEITKLGVKKPLKDIRKGPSTGLS